MRSLNNKNRDSFDTIREYVAGDSNNIVLSDVQQAQLNRWNFYINLKLQGELKTSEIVKRMMDEFNVERATCFNDMGYAEALYGYSSSLNKRFRIAARIDFIEEKIKELWNKHWLDESGEQNLFGAETLQARNELAAKLESTLQKYYDAYPEMKHDRSPRIINYNFTKNEYNVEDLPDVADAEEIIKLAAKENL